MEEKERAARYGKRVGPSFPRFRNSENVEVLLRHGLSFPRFENYQNVKDPPTNTSFAPCSCEKYF